MARLRLREPNAVLRVHEDHGTYVTRMNPLCGHEGDGAYDKSQPAQ